jgi:ribonuclease HI
MGPDRVWECSRLFVPVPGRERETSNNVAEYSGFVAILEYLLAEGLDDRSATIHGDSKLVIEQQRGSWRIKQGLYVPLAIKARGLLQSFRRPPKLVWIPRDENEVADELSKRELIRAGVRFRIQPMNGGKKVAIAPEHEEAGDARGSAA